MGGCDWALTRGFSLVGLGGVLMVRREEPGRVP